MCDAKSFTMSGGFREIDCDQSQCNRLALAEPEHASFQWVREVLSAVWLDTRQCLVSDGVTRLQ